MIGDQSRKKTDDEYFTNSNQGFSHKKKNIEKGIIDINIL